ncbi:hypothetical protein NCG89_02920 [Spongiibacter taiwanensis]|uniref:hypothetical protein n=1 Tax=Spongiibacter taiwanensis TaxID=1748242 RepID=UPI002035F020|nr:hypothetical protein [Spongiibacter taiwanensis]USA43748.1 hypothetical protein NCG89_02920 [Spongiibacter taiwanensis]
MPSYQLVLRSSFAGTATYTIIFFAAELSLRLPLDSTEQCLTVFHIGAATSLVALLWSIAPRHSFLFCGSLFILSATLPTWLMVLCR